MLCIVRGAAAVVQTSNEVMNAMHACVQPNHMHAVLSLSAVRHICFVVVSHNSVASEQPIASRQKATVSMIRHWGAHP